MLHALPIALCLIAQQPKADPPSPLDVVTAMETVLADAIAKAEPSIVAISRDKGKGDETTAVKGRNPPLEPPRERDIRFGFGGQESSQSDTISFDYGSGVVVGDKGEILTAFHVVKGASKIMVKAWGRQKFEAEIIAADPRSDLAVIVPREVRGGTPPKLTPIKLGDATKLRKGSFLLALGNPFNAARDGRASASWGILSNIARKLDLSPREDQQLRHYPTLLQLDAKLNLGMSGGAVLNLKGELVGLTTDAANVSGFDAQAGYAYPVDKLGRRAIETLIQGKEVEYGLIGIKADEDKSNHVGAVSPGTPASDGGLVAGDQIIAVGATPVADFEALVTAVNAYAPGEPVRLKIVREGETIEKTLLLAKYLTIGEVIVTNSVAPWRGLQVDYLSVLAAKNMFGQDQIEAMSRGGVAITEVVPGSPADLAGLRPNQIIVTVGDHPVKTPTEFRRTVADLVGPVDLTVERSRKVTVK
jgi:serine protease Do